MPDQNSPDSAAIWLSVVAVFISGVALFRNLIRDLIFRPKLSFKFSFYPPDSHRVRAFEQGVGWYLTYYFAVKVWNKGRTKAENVKVKLVDLYKKIGDSWKLVDEINPDQLLWRLTGLAYEPNINPETFEYCNLGYIVDPAKRPFIKGEDNPNERADSKETVFHIQLSAPSRNYPHLIRPGTYKLGIEASCSNGKKKRAEYELELKGGWFEDEERMLKDGIRINPIRE